jgi:transposase
MTTMFLRSAVVKKAGKSYRYWKLVETVRTAAGPRQRVVAHLGGLAHFTAADWERLAQRLGEPAMAAALERRVRQGGRKGRPPKWTLQDRVRAAPDAVTIRLGATSWRNPLPCGDVYAGLVLWQRLGLGALLAEKLAPSRAEVPWATIAALIAVNRLVDPMPEWRMVRWWRTTALPPLLGLPVALVDDNRLYRCLDAVLPHKAAIEEHLAGRGQTLFGQSYRFLLYDLTSTYFEGQVPHNPKAKRGYSRDRRPDCKQVCIGAVVDREGFPVGYEVVAGNVKDHQTVAGMLERLRTRFGLTDRTLCMDRGLVTVESLQVIRQAHVAYVLADRRNAAAAFAAQVATGPWQALRTDRQTGQALVEVQEGGREDGDRLILVRSQGCREKEQGIHTRLLTRLTGALDQLARTVQQGRLVDPAKIERRIGRILARHPGLARWVCVRREDVTAETGKGRSVVHWHVKEEAEALARQLEGVYLLRTNVEGTPAAQVWEDYVTLVRVEEAFRTLKHDLKLRPLCHHREDRTEGHVLFAWIAYAMYWVLERTHRRHGGTLTGRRVLEVLHGITLGTISLTTVQGLKLERISTPRPEEAAVLHSLRITLPRPKRRLDRVDLTLPEDRDLFRRQQL